MSLAFLFPGQGSQYPGMTATIESIYPPARALFEEANRILGIDLHSLAQQGPAGELTRTENAQPALLMVSVCWLQFLLAQGISPKYLAGHSLGEYSALVASGALNWRDALRLVRRRGELMSAAAAKQSGGMVAVIGLGQDSLLEVLREASRTGCVELANYNTAEQVVLSGEFPALEKASELARKRGAKLVRSLQVSGPFHSSLMRPVAEQFQKELDQFAFQDAEIPVLSNVAARPMQRAEEIRHDLILQIDHPVLWVDSIRWLFANSVDHFLEVGSKNVLTGLVRCIVPEAKAEAVEEQFSKEGWCPPAGTLQPETVAIVSVRDVDERARNLRKKQDHSYNSNKEDTMNEQEIADKVKTLVANRLGTPVEQIALETRFSEDLNADSLDVVDLIMALEEAFQVKIPDNEAQQIKTVSDTVAFLLSHLSQSA